MVANRVAKSPSLAKSILREINARLAQLRAYRRALAKSVSGMAQGKPFRTALRR